MFLTEPHGTIDDGDVYSVLLSVRSGLAARGTHVDNQRREVYAYNRALCFSVGVSKMISFASTDVSENGLKLKKIKNTSRNATRAALVITAHLVYAMENAVASVCEARTFLHNHGLSKYI